MQFTQRRSVQPASGRRSRSSILEALEPRMLLSGTRHQIPQYDSAYVPSDLKVFNPITGSAELVSVRKLKPASLTTNEGKIVSGTDREGDQWTITVHGPGKVIVTDTTPNDGSLDDDIATIQLVGTSLYSTYVTGTVTAADRPEANFVDSTEGQSNEKIFFNSLIATTGVKSIELNGFVLTRQVSPPVSHTPEISLTGGVQTLSFDSINGLTDSASTTAPINIIIGDATNPLPNRIQPSIYLNSIQNTVYDSTVVAPPELPLVTPNVSFQVNGVVRNFSIVAATGSPIFAAYQFQLPVIGTTGRTSLQANAVKNLSVRGSAINFTVSHDATPFSGGKSGVKYLNKATFGGNADGVGLDVNGPIRKLEFKKGLGNPAGVFTGTSSSGASLPATSYGINQGSTGYPASGYLGGQVRAKRIGKLKVGPANTVLQTPQDPQFDQLAGPQSITYIASPGSALTSAAITTSGSIGKVKVVGNQVNSEIKTGFDYTSYAAGLEGTRAASRIRRLDEEGSLINSVDSASVRPNANGVYSKSTNTVGNGSIKGKVTGSVYNTGGTTALGNTGSGVFARILSRRIRAKN